MGFIGAHVSTKSGIDNAPLNAKKINATAFALFTKNQRQWAAKPLSIETILQFQENCRQNNYSPAQIVAHDSYLINLGHPEKQGLEKSRTAFLDEMKRCQDLGLEMLNFHPGSYLKKISQEECLKKIAQSINQALEKTVGVTAVIENTAGQGTNVGYCFEHLALIIDLVEDKSRVGICLDTCHLFASGYDIKTKDAYTKTMKQFDEIVGMSYLKAWHLNDSKKALNSRVDRHENLGKGFIGLDAFNFISTDPRFDKIPMILETPDNSVWFEEIKRLSGQ